MNKLIEILNKITTNPTILWLLGTTLAFVCGVASVGIHWSCGILAIWVIVTLIAMHAKRNGW